MTVTLLPSATNLVVAWLVGNPDIAALVSDRVGTRLDPVLPAIRVQRVGGSPDETWRDNPEVQVECWAANDIIAERVALTVIEVLPTIRKTTTGGRVYTYEIASGPFFIQDDPALSTNSRFILTVRMLITKP